MTDSKTACLLPPEAEQAQGADFRDERRASPRVATFHFVLIRAETPGSLFQWAPILNLSLTGVGLLLKQSCAPGERLSVVFQLGSVRNRVATVVHSTPKEDSWLIGCTLDAPLTVSEFHALTK